MCLVHFLFSLMGLPPPCPLFPSSLCLSLPFLLPTLSLLHRKLNGLDPSTWVQDCIQDVSRKTDNDKELQQTAVVACLASMFLPEKTEERECQ